MLRCMSPTLRSILKDGIFWAHFTYQKFFQVFVVGDDSIMNNNKF